jgi:hypothetical protein
MQITFASQEPVDEATQTFCAAELIFSRSAHKVEAFRGLVWAVLVQLVLVMTAIGVVMSFR